jgi:hypothetical protein
MFAFPLEMQQLAAATGAYAPPLIHRFPVRHGHEVAGFKEFHYRGGVLLRLHDPYIIHFHRLKPKSGGVATV